LIFFIVYKIDFIVYIMFVILTKRIEGGGGTIIVFSDTHGGTTIVPPHTHGGTIIVFSDTHGGTIIVSPIPIKGQ
jgi:hypothetical protein